MATSIANMIVHHHHSSTKPSGVSERGEKARLANGSGVRKVSVGSSADPQGHHVAPTIVSSPQPSDGSKCRRKSGQTWQPQGRSTEGSLLDFSLGCHALKSEWGDASIRKTVTMKSVRIVQNNGPTKRDVLTEILGEASKLSGHPFERTPIEFWRNSTAMWPGDRSDMPL